MKRSIAIALCAVSLAGCTSVQPRQAFPEVARQVQERTGARAVWNQNTAADDAVQQAINDLLARDLSADSAVQIALLNNPSAQATYEELGIAEGELVQAGLLSNPIFAALLRFPDGGRGDPNLELSVSTNFIELLTLSLKKKIAAAEYESAKARVAGEIVTIAANVREAFYTAAADEQMVELRQSAADAAAASAEAAQRIRDAGNNTELSLASEQADSAQAQNDLETARAEAAKDRENLIVLLGGPHEIKLAGRLPALPTSDGDLQDVETTALHQRLDFAVTVADLNTTYASLGMARRFTWLSGADLTIDGEHEVDGSWVTGPGVTVPIPIFDTGAAQISVANSRVRQARQRLAAMAIQIRSEARSARTDMLAARARAERYRDIILPLRVKITRQTQLQFNGMLMSVYQLLDAKRNEIDAGRGYVEALRDYWIARAHLERAVGGRLPNSGAIASTTQPSVAPPQNGLTPSMNMPGMK